MPEAMRHTDQGYLSTFPEERLRKAASSFFSLTDFPSEIKWTIQEKEIQDANREIEIISQQNAIKRYLLSKYGDEDGACHFGRRSCEDIAAEILNQFENSTSCTVLEDGFGGARVVR